jgi:small conductance mechanosensitive channel
MDQIQVYFNQLSALAVMYLPRIGGAILLWIIGSWLISRLVKLASAGMEVRHLDISLQGFLRSLINVGLRVLLLFAVAGQLGIETTSFIAVLGAAGLAVGLALQGSLGNFAGGVLLLIFRPFKIGDVIASGGQTGVVKEIQIFNTILLAADNRTIILPNGPVSNGTIINFSQEGTLGFDIQVELDGKHDFEEVKAVAMQMMQEDPRILSPGVGIAKLGAGMTVSVNGRTKVEDQLAVAGSLNERIKIVFAKNGFAGPEVHTFVHSVAG